MMNLLKSIRKSSLWIRAGYGQILLPKAEISRFPNFTDQKEYDKILNWTKMSFKQFICWRRQINCCWIGRMEEEKQ